MRRYYFNLLFLKSRICGTFWVTFFRIGRYDTSHIAYVDPGDGSRHALELGQGDAQRAVAGATRAVDRVEAPQRLVEVDGDPVLEAKGSDATRRVTDRRLGHGRAGGIELPDAVGQPIACQVGTDVFDGDEITPFLRS